MTALGIVASGVRRSFGAVQAVRDVNLEARAGAVTGLVGPNGSGKTTLLLMLASLLAPDAGTIRIGGIDPVAAPEAARAILGWMPDALGAWPSLTARETLVMTSRLYGLDTAAAAGGAARLLDEVGLTHLADAPARVLSRGQKQRLGLARALVHDPRVLLLDEPASGLDPQARIDLRVLLRRLAAEGRTILISSHPVRARRGRGRRRVPRRGRDRQQRPRRRRRDAATHVAHPPGGPRARRGRPPGGAGARA